MTGRPEREVVEGGPSRAPLTDRVPQVWRRRDAEGVVHGELGGDHDAALELALIDHLHAVCGPRTQD